MQKKIIIIGHKESKKYLETALYLLKTNEEITLQASIASEYFDKAKEIIKILTEEYGLKEFEQREMVNGGKGKVIKIKLRTKAF